MRVVGLVDFQHVSPLGNEHAHRLFDLVKVARTPESLERNPDFPNSLDDYTGFAPAGSVKEVPENGKPKPIVLATKLVWEFPEKNQAEAPSP